MYKAQLSAAKLGSANYAILYKNKQMKSYDENGNRRWTTKVTCTGNKDKRKIENRLCQQDQKLKMKNWS